MFYIMPNFVILSYSLLTAAGKYGMLNLLGRLRGCPFFLKKPSFFPDLARYTWKHSKIAKKLSFCELTVSAPDGIMDSVKAKPL